MALSKNEIVKLAQELRKNFAGTNLPRPLAKLYSQYTRLRAGQSGLSSWQEEETTDRLNDALHLLDAAFIERDDGSEYRHDSAKRAGALLEWLSHPQLNADELPIRLLAAAAYQLAGYPALSKGLLGEDVLEAIESNILYFLLKAEFPKLLEQLTEYWGNNLSILNQKQMELPWQNSEELSQKLQQQVVKETASALGILCAEMRWGKNTRVQPALEKLSTIGQFLLNGDDSYSWLLAKLCAEVAKVYVQSSLRSYVSDLSQKIDETGKKAFERYLRQCFQRNKTLAWPSQVIGIKRLINDESFVLCTPTGSGKTTIAELAILQSLFLEFTSASEELTSIKPAPIALYLVPSRALAAEVEANLSRVLRDLNEPPINVTGLYGGTDWGPTDAWLTSDVRTVLICTYEKAEALIRFLGPLFLQRVSLVVIDEAHSIQFNDNVIDLRKAESRSLRLEALSTRLFTYLDESKGRVIALSAVASQMQNTLAHWVTGNENANPAETLYRSTRQLIGRLECHANRSFMIHYDLLDGADLQFDKRGNVGSTSAESPYITSPFDPCPSTGEWEPKKANAGPEKRLRPYLLWAAMQLASQYYQGTYGAVLISVTQLINSIAGDFLIFLDKIWANEKKPVFFLPPQDEKKKELWEKCLRSCEDYFGKQSHEYKLLEKGIVVHHGKMPGLMARLLIQVVQERIVHIVLATSTLSEGVNLPIETVIIPSILRRGDKISSREFSNLIGRAGRPGIGTEGRSLVLLENELGHKWDKAQEIRNTRRRYEDLIKEIKEQVEVTDGKSGAQSSLAALIGYLEEQWNRHLSSNHMHFFDWLEAVSPLDITEELEEETGLGAIEAIDTLDGVLLAAITELEQVNTEPLTLAQLENRLRQIWRRSYAYYAAQGEKHLAEIFLRRGQALQSTIYPETAQRRRLYHTSLPPRSGNELLKLYPAIREELKKGEEYGLWRNENEKDKRFRYIEKIVGLLGTSTKFELKNKRKGKKEIRWQDILHWWLDPDSGIGPQTASEISEWYDYVYKNFEYKICWGLGSILALAGDDAHGGIIMASTLDDWPLMQLPWVVFWLKELLTWGTLEPVAAYLLAMNIKSTRRDAEEAAELYYKDQPLWVPDELLNASTIRKWADIQYKQNKYLSSKRPPESMRADLLRDFTKVTNKLWRVIPVESEGSIFWSDPGGFQFAVSRKPTDWNSHFLSDYDFELDASTSVVSSTPYF